MPKRELEISTRLTREDAAGIVEDLIDGLKDGCLKVHKGGEHLQIDAPRVVDLKLEASADEERAEVKIEFSWLVHRVAPDNVPDEQPAAVKRPAGVKSVTRKSVAKPETAPKSAGTGRTGGRAKSVAKPAARKSKAD
ncbi:MAG: amphi-Trp domain-containing protein [Desulfovibrio sp.]|nr:amphi-Trp domain-containing protein [Desulfovibrio sp.]